MLAVHNATEWTIVIHASVWVTELYMSIVIVDYFAYDLEIRALRVNLLFWIIKIKAIFYHFHQNQIIIILNLKYLKHLPISSKQNIF